MSRPTINRLRFWLIVFIFGLVQSSAVARILTTDEVGLADTQALIAETDVFKSIGMGIALSIAICEGVEDCIPSVDEEELKQLLEALDNRISHIQDIINSEGISEDDLNQILTAYVDERENYLRYLDQLGTISPEPVETEFEEEPFTEDIFSDVDEEVEDFSVFEDADDELIDDEEFMDDAEFEEELDSEDL